MEFQKPLIHGRLVRRYKRFLADVRLADGRVVTAHCPNSGSMAGCCDPGWRVALSPSANPNRRTAYTWELVHNGTCWIGINTHLANTIAKEAIAAGRVPELRGYPRIETEKRYGRNSRIDILLHAAEARCYVEVKNVTLVGADGCYCFPDAVTRRGRKHLTELEDMVAHGHRAVMLYVVQRADGTMFRPAREIDPDYADALRHAHTAGVEILAYQADVAPTGIRLMHRLESRPD